MTMQSESKGATTELWENVELIWAHVHLPCLSYILFIFQAFHNVRNFFWIRNVTQEVNVFPVLSLAFVLFTIR